MATFDWNSFEDAPKEAKPTKSAKGASFDWDKYPDADSGVISKFGDAMVRGSSIGENLPLIGEPIAQAGTLIGDASQAALEAMLSDKKYGDLYDRNRKLSQAQYDKEAAFDKASPAAKALKTALATSTIGGIQQPVKPTAPWTKPGSWGDKLGRLDDPKQLKEYLADLAKKTKDSELWKTAPEKAKAIAKSAATKEIGKYTAGAFGGNAIMSLLKNLFD